MACLTAAFGRLSLASSKAVQVLRPSTGSRALCSSSSSFAASQRLSVCRSVERSPASCTVVAGYKLKTRKAAAKRYKVTGSGKVMTRKPGKQHINEKKSPKRLRRLGKEQEVAHSNLSNIIPNLPYAKINK